MRLYRARPHTVQVHQPEGEDFVVIEHPDGDFESLPRDKFQARYEPLLDMSV